MNEEEFQEKLRQKVYDEIVDGDYTAETITKIAKEFVAEHLEVVVESDLTDDGFYVAEIQHRWK